MALRKFLWGALAGHQLQDPQCGTCAPGPLSCTHLCGHLAAVDAHRRAASLLQVAAALDLDSEARAQLQLQRRAGSA